MFDLSSLEDDWYYDAPIIYSNKSKLMDQSTPYQQAGGCNQNDRSLDPVQAGYYDLLQ